MSQMDADGSGSVDVGEFIAWFTREKAIDVVVSHLNLASALAMIHKSAKALEHTASAERCFANLNRRMNSAVPMPP